MLLIFNFIYTPAKFQVLGSIIIKSRTIPLRESTAQNRLIFHLCLK